MVFPPCVPCGFLQDNRGLVDILTCVAGVEGLSAAAPGTSETVVGSSSFSTVSKFTFQKPPAGVSNRATIGDGGKTASSPGWARATTGISSGKALWYFELTKDAKSDERTTLGVCTESPDASYSSTGWWVYRAYNGELHLRWCLDAASWKGRV